MKGYFEDRNRHVAHSLKVLTETLARRGDLAQLTLVEIRGRVAEKRGIRTTSMFHVLVSLGSDKYEITIDDGFEDTGSWYFSDKPLRLENLSTGKAVSLQGPK